MPGAAEYLTSPRYVVTRDELRAILRNRRVSPLIADAIIKQIFGARGLSADRWRAQRRLEKISDRVGEAMIDLTPPEGWPHLAHLAQQ
jgi:hypothetical protein